MPPSATRTNLRPMARAIGLAEDWSCRRQADPTRVTHRARLPGRAVRSGWSSSTSRSTAQLADSEELDDAILHVVEPVVVRVEHCSRRVEVEWCRRCGSPHGSSKMRSSHVRIQPCSGDCGAGALQPVDLLVDAVLERCRAASSSAELGAVLADDVVVTLAKLLADGCQLLAQQDTRAAACRHPR